MIKTISFAKALDIADTKYSKRHLIVGNGLSIALRPEIFSYGSLYEQSEIPNDSHLKSLFDALNTTDFESVIKSLESASKLVPLYGGARASIKMLEDANRMKEILINTVAQNHPERPYDITDDEYASCIEFLANFIGPNTKGYVFTLNYDILLYWAMMKSRGGDLEGASHLDVHDGFGEQADAAGNEYVVWHGEDRAHYQRVFYLHGALHLFDAQHELQKYTWSRTNKCLVDQARNAMGKNKFPLFVSEGPTNQKLYRIRHNAYLFYALRKLTAQAATRRHCFFLHGHSLAENDYHILTPIGRGNCDALFVSIYGDINSVSNQKIVANARYIASLRGKGSELKLYFYDSESAHVWDALKV